MTQMEAPAAAQVNASSCTPALSLKAEIGMIPLRMVEAVRAPTVRAPVISKIRQRTMACWYVTERDETLVAHAFATSLAPLLSVRRWTSQQMRFSALLSMCHGRKTVEWYSKAIVVLRDTLTCLEQRKERAYGENVGILLVRSSA